MSIVAISLGAIVTALLGRLMFGGWYNHLVLYAGSWCISLVLFEAGLIHYYPLEAGTWMIIGAGWSAFVFGAGVAYCGRYAVRNDTVGSRRTQEQVTSREDSLLLRTLWILNFIVVADALHQIYVVIRLIGSFSNFFSLANLVYDIRASEGLPGAIPYLGSLGLTALFFAGVYTSMIGRLRLVAIVPVIAVIISSITNMTRAFIIVGFLLFVTGFFLNKGRVFRTSRVFFVGKIKRALVVIFVIGLVATGMEVVRGNRGTVESFSGASTTLNRLGRSAGSFLTPSIVWYISGSHGVLNQYLKRGTENLPIGNYSLAPFWRILSKLGFKTYVAQHQPFYKTPVYSNVGSYLRELHADYGIAGVIIGPFLIGLAATVFWLRYQRSRSLRDFVILGHIYVVVGMSIFTLAISMGNWLASFLSGLVIASIYNKKLRLQDLGAQI